MSTRDEGARRAQRAAFREELYDRIKAADLDLVDAVRMMRKVAGKSQAEYARLVGISPRVLIDFERGVGNPTLETLRKILEPFALELTVRRRGNDERRRVNTTRPMRGVPATVVPELRRRLSAILARPDVAQVRIGIDTKRSARPTASGDGNRTMVLYEAESAAAALEMERELLETFADNAKVAAGPSPDEPRASGAGGTYVHVTIVPARR